MQPNYFELLNVPVQFAQDEQQMQSHWKAASARVHPDRFATASAAEKRVAVQWAARINEAYQCLKDPLQRALYLCALGGAPLETEQNTVKDPMLLMRQMELREQLDEADTPEAVAALKADVQGRIQTLIARVEPDLNALGQKGAAGAVQAASGAAAGTAAGAPDAARVQALHNTLCEWMFLNKFLRSLPTS